MKVLEGRTLKSVATQNIDFTVYSFLKFFTVFYSLLKVFASFSWKCCFCLRFLMVLLAGWLANI